jgi:nitrate reductase alpha subunit
MDDQGDLFGGREEGRRRRNASMEQADEAADAEWKAAFMNACYIAAKELRWLSTDDVFKRLPEGVDTHERRAAGPRMLEAVKNGWIRKSGLPNRETDRPTNHSRPLTVWESMLYGNPYANLDD